MNEMIIEIGTMDMHISKNIVPIEKKHITIMHEMTNPNLFVTLILQEVYLPFY